MSLRLENSKRSSLAAREAEARRALRRDARLARSYAPEIRRVFRAEGRAVAQAAGSAQSFEQARQRALGQLTEERWERALSKMWLGGAPKAVWGDTLAQLGGPATGWEEELPALFRRQIEGQAQEIVRTTRRALLALEAEPLKVARSAELMQKAAQKLYKGFGKTRAGRIAINTVLQATAAVQHAAAAVTARATGAELHKTWVTVGDAAVRASHAEVQGTSIPKGAYFSVGGSQLLHPRDPSGPPGETINCRCWLTWERVGGASTERGALGAPVEEQAPERLPPLEPLDRPARRRHPYINPDRIDEVSIRQQEWLQQIADRYPDVSVENLKSWAPRGWQPLLDSGEVRIAVDEDTLTKILNEGRFKSQFETRTSAGFYDPTSRSKIESRLFGYADDLDPTLRPIYGYVGQPGVRHHSAAAYGEIDVVLKQSVRPRVTVTMEDSFDTVLAASPIDEVTAEAFDWAGARHSITPDKTGSWKAMFNPDAKTPSPSTFTYVEAQIHEQVTLDDFAEVIFVEDPLREVAEMLDANGIDWYVRGG